MSVFLLARAAPDPVGPEHWPWNAWLGLLLYLGLFALALWAITRLVRAPAREDREDQA